MAAPNNPSNLQLEALHGGSVDVSWSDNSADETAFKIFRDDQLIMITSADVTSYRDTGASPSTAYQYTKATSDLQEANEFCTPLHKTGQTTSYKSGDDGSTQKGAKRSYTRDDENGIVTDNVTNLMWQDNESVAKVWITRANYDAGDYTNTSGDTATAYCENLTLGGHSDWRLPTNAELVYLTDKSTHNPNIDSVFQATSRNNYWSSTTNAEYSNHAWYVSFNNEDDNHWVKYSDNYVRCVRAEEVANVEVDFVRDDELEVVNDTTTCLMWQDDTGAAEAGDQDAWVTGGMYWSDAIDYCEDLSLAGFDDWRLPNFNELYSIGDKSRFNPSIKPAFLNTFSHQYWSTTAIAGSNSASYAWTVNFDNQFTTHRYNNHENFYYVRCVRGGE